MLTFQQKTSAAPLPTIKGNDKKPQLEEFIQKRDFRGAMALLEFEEQAGEPLDNSDHWKAFCSFHLGEYEKALKILRHMLENAPDPDPQWHVYAGCCLFFLGRYEEAEREARAAPTSKLQTRLGFHIAHRRDDSTKLMQHHQKLSPSSLEDQLTLASVHYTRGHVQEAADIYKKMLLENRDNLALNVYLAMCYYKMDYYDYSMELLNPYLKAYPDSITAINLKACNKYRLLNGKAAKEEMKVLEASPFANENLLVKHNTVIFNDGERAFQVLPPLVDVIPEARLNIVVFHLRNKEYHEAYNLIKDVEPSTPQEYILKAVVCTHIGQQDDSSEHIKLAQNYYQTVGSSPSECDTIPGRQCMASCFHLLKQFEDELVYLDSVKSYVGSDDEFLYTYGIAKAATGSYSDAAEALLAIQNEEYRAEFSYMAWLARCLINIGYPNKAWELYLNMETSSESFRLLEVIANDCYKVGAFFYAAKAFDVLERVDPNSTFLEGKRGACVGVFQMCIAGVETHKHLQEVVSMLRNSNNPQMNTIVTTIRRWAKANKVKV